MLEKAIRICHEILIDNLFVVLTNLRNTYDFLIYLSCQYVVVFCGRIDHFH